MASEYASLNAVSKAAVSFAKNYNTGMDSSMETRAALLDCYCEPTTPNTPLMEWNGHTLMNKEQVAGYFQSLPKTKHELRSVDAQPLPGCDQADSFVITISGRCTYDDEHVRYYYHRLVVAKSGERHYVVHDYLRWTGEEIH
jgi:hypothetical protein